MSERCRTCNGQGHVKCLACNGSGNGILGGGTKGWTPCSRCDGSGQIKCPACQGSGQSKQSK